MRLAAQLMYDILYERFEGIVIVCRVNMNYDAVSSRTKLSLWGFLKSHVYANKSLTTAVLKANTRICHAMSLNSAGFRMRLDISNALLSE